MPPAIVLVPVPDTPPVNDPVMVGVVQVYTVFAGTIPLVTLAGVTLITALKLGSVHKATVIGLMAGFGFTVTGTVNVVPRQLPEPEGPVGVTV